MAVGNVSREMLDLTTVMNARQYDTQLRFQVLPLSLLILALILTAGMAFFRSDYWLLGASFIAGGFLVVSALMYLASKTPPDYSRSVSRGVNAKHLGTGTASTAAGTVAILAVMGDVGANLGTVKVFVAQIGFALVVMGAFWLVLTLRDMI